MSLKNLSLRFSHIAHGLFLQKLQLLPCLFLGSHIAGHFRSRILNRSLLYDLLRLLKYEQLSDRDAGKYAFTLTSFHKYILLSPAA